MASIVSLLTAEEYGRLPEGDRPSELVRGVIVPEVRTSFRKGRVCSEINGAIADHVFVQQLGQTTTNIGVITERDPDTVREVDVAYFSFARLPKHTHVEIYAPVAPDLAVEVRSPGESWEEVHQRVAECLSAGVTVVVVADTESQTLSLFHADKPAQTRAAPNLLTLPEVLPGFSVPVSELFE